MKNKTFFILLIINVVVLAACATVEKQVRTVYGSVIEADNSINAQTGYPDEILRVATLNLAHGRKDGFNQLFLWKSTFKENLDDIAVSLSQHKPHIVALQEADASSTWSGSFDHVQYLATQARYPWRTQVINAESWLFSYGTAILSVLPLAETIKHTFAPSPPTLNKGLVVAQVDMPYRDGSLSRKIDVVSVHLDFSRKSVRKKQIDEMKEILSARMNPTIILGDFNSEWLAEASVIKELATNSRFYAYEPETSYYNTYKNKRLDWILITKDLEFADYNVLSETLSDHDMVIAEIRFKDNINDLETKFTSHKAQNNQH